MEEVLKKLEEFLHMQERITPAYTFDDVLLAPKHSVLKPDEFIDTSTWLCKGVRLNVPFVAAAMDTVTGRDMAIMMARNGAIGIIHRNCPIEVQCEKVMHVKRHQGNMVTNPMTLTESSQMKDAFAIYQTFGFATIPIVTQEHNKLLGLITKTHLEDYRENENKLLADIMIPFAELILVSNHTSLENAGKIMKEKRIKCLPIVVSEDVPTLVGMYFKKDIQNKEKHPSMAVDEKGRLLVGAAIGVGDAGFTRATALIEVGVDVLCIDTAQGDSFGVIDMLVRLKNVFPDIPVIAGNVVTTEGAQRLIDAGADAIKVGVGPGAICTTREKTGNGMPQLTAIMNVAQATKKASIPLIADGGIKTQGDVVKALAAGADSVMMGSVFAGTDEAPGEVIEENDGKKYKIYRGMGSKEAMQSQGGVANDRYLGVSQNQKVAEGVSGFVPYKGPVQSILDSYIQALIKSMLVYQGAKTIASLQENPTFVSQTQSGKFESAIRVIL